MLALRRPIQSVSSLGTLDRRSTHGETETSVRDVEQIDESQLVAGQESLLGQDVFVPLQREAQVSFECLDVGLVIARIAIASHKLNLSHRTERDLTRSV